MRAFALALLLAGCAGPTNVSVDELRQVADAFDAAQVTKDRAALDRLVDPALVFVEGDGTVSDKRAFVAGWLNPATTFETPKITGRRFTPLAPDAGVVDGETVLRGTAGGKPFASHIHFADTFRRTDGVWRAVHIQVTRVSR